MIFRTCFLVSAVESFEKEDDFYTFLASCYNAEAHQELKNPLNKAV